MKSIKVGDKSKFGMEVTDTDVDTEIHNKIVDAINGTHTIDSFTKWGEKHYKVEITCIEECYFENGKFYKI